jgi:hypothetical protein
MADVEVPYCTRAAVQRELGYADNFRTNRRIDAKILQASRDAEKLCNRFFYPLTATRSFDVPETDTLWLYQHELTSVETIVSGETTMAADDYILRPESGPPYGWIDINWSGQVGWQAADTWQRAIAITGEYHHPVTTTAGPALNGTITGSASSLAVSSSADAGPGSILLIGTERMICTDAALATTTATITADLTAQKADNALTVSDGTLLHQGELIAIGAERMSVESIAGNTVTVTRAASGSTLATHSSTAVVYAPRSLTVARAQMGTVSASHADDTQIYLLTPPSLVGEYVLAATCAALEHGSSGYARTVGTGESQRAADDRGLGSLADRLYAAYGRKARSRAVC